MKFFPELNNDRIINSIKRHMFPLTLIPPKYKEGFIITCVDKMNSVNELPSVKVIVTKAKNKFLNVVLRKN